MGILRPHRSAPCFGRVLCGGMAERLKAADCKSVLIEYAGSNPAPSTTYLLELSKFKKA